MVKEVKMNFEEEMNRVPYKNIGAVLAVHSIGVFQLDSDIPLLTNLVLTSPTVKPTMHNF